MMFSAITKRLISARCKSQGIGSMNEEERGNEAVKDLSALSDQLQKMPFLLGSDITVYDFSVAAMLSSVIFVKPCNWHSNVAKNSSIFPEYLERVRDRLGGYEFVRFEALPLQPLLFCSSSPLGLGSAMLNPKKCKILGQ